MGEVEDDEDLHRRGTGRWDWLRRTGVGGERDGEEG